MKKLMALMLAGTILALAGCQPTPEKTVVTSKNDGAFQAALENTESPDPARTEASAQPEPGQSGEPEAVTYTDSFTSADGDISIDLALTEPVVSGPVPVLTVRPMEISGQQAEKMARALFGDEEIYEYSEEMTRAEIEQSILDYRQFISDWDAMLDYYGGNEETARQVKEDFEGRIARLEEAYQTASEETRSVPCAWEFHPSSYYQSPDMAGMFADDGAREIKAMSTLEGQPWVFSVINREEGYRVHNASAFPINEQDAREMMEGSGAGMDAEAMKAWALAAAERMDMGQWALLSDTAARATGLGGGWDLGDQYSVLLTRVYDGVQAAPYGDAPDTAEQYAAVYGPETMQFQFIAGHLSSFWYLAASQTVGAANEDVALLPFGEVLERAKEQMKMLTAERMLITGVDIRVTADRVELGLACVPMKDNATDYYLAPCYGFYGTAAAYEADGQPTMVQYNDGERQWEEPAQAVLLLAAINAVDGSVIHPNGIF